MIVRFYFWTISLFILSFKDVICERRGGVSKYRNGRIVGGLAIEIENVPYQAFLSLKEGSSFTQCGGSIISTRVILTAAHCLNGVSEVSVRVGSSLSDSGGTTIISNNFIQHPKFDKNTSDYDVAIVYLPWPIKLDGINTTTVNLPDDGTCIKPGTKLLVSGWGYESENGSTTTSLRAVVLYVFGRTKCAEKHNLITTHMFCAGIQEGGKDSCQGDSGGPAVSTNNIQLGIVSFGVGCGREGIPGVYTNIASVRNWIKSKAGV